MKAYKNVVCRVNKVFVKGWRIRQAWLYFNCADLPQLAGALTSSAKDVSPAVPFLDSLGF
jgi:hypothetical protein